MPSGIVSAVDLVTVAWLVLALAALLRRPPPVVPDLATATTPEPSPLRAPRLGARRRSRRRSEAIAEAVPDVIDLFAVAIAAGLNNRLALRAVATQAPPGELTDALARVDERVTSAGARLADAIERLPDELGTDAVRPLVAAITDAERYGAALGPTLDRLADDARRSQQRRAEEAARRIPVKLLLPLVTCILPAFGLLTVAPLIAGGLRALRL